MPRSSRHRSHREHKYGERSDSEEDRNSRGRKERVEEQGSGSRVSRDRESEKRKSSSLSQPGGEDMSVEQGRKRKKREEDLAASDRLNGAREDDRVADLGPKGENSGVAESEKATKSKLSAVASRERSRRRSEGSAERFEDGSSKVDLTKRRSEKDLSRESSRRESSSQYKDAKEKGRERGPEKDLSRDLSRRESNSQYKDAKEKDRDHGLERDKKAHGSRHERPDDVGSSNQVAKTSCSEDERALKKDKELTEWQIRDDLCNFELIKELEKPMGGADGSTDREKRQGDGRDSDDRRLSSRDDCPKNESYRNEGHRGERHKDGRYRDKYREDLDRDQRHRDDRHREECSSRDRASNRSGSKHHRDENWIPENHYKKSKLQDSDQGGSYGEDHSKKYKDSRGRRRSFDENDDYGDLRPQSAKESDGDIDRAWPDKTDSNRSHNQPKSSPSSVVHAIKDQSRHSSRQAELAHQDLSPGERDHSSAATVGDVAGISRGRDGTSDSWSLEKTKTKDHISSGEYLIETAASSKFVKTRRSDGRSPSVQLIEKSQAPNDQQFLYRGGTRRSNNIEDVAKRGGSYKDQRDYPTDDVRERKLLLKSPRMNDYSKTENREHVPLGPSFNRNGRFPGSSPGHLPPPAPVRHGIGSPVLGSYEDDNLSQIGDHKSSSRYRKNSNFNTGGQGSDWKNVPTWPSPVANGFPPFQHGPMPPGFPSAMQQFPAPSAPSLFGMRPYMDVTHAHIRPFGWHNIMEGPYPQVQRWDGRTGILGDDSHAYGRPEWDHRNRHLMDSRGWEPSAGMWKVQNGNSNIEIPQTQESNFSTHSLADEGWAVQQGNKSSSEQAHSESTEIKRSNDAPAAMNAAEAPPETIDEKTPVPSKTAGDDHSRFCCNYLAKLDISVDLASPELYKQCLTLLGTKGPGVCNISKHGCHQNNNDVNKVVGKSPNNLLTSLFPTNTEAFFQRAMSLYKRQREAAKAMFPVATAKGQKDSPEVSDADKVKVIDEQPPEEMSLTNANSCRSKEEGSNVIAEAEDDVPGDANDGKSTNANALGDLSGDAKEQHSDVISDAVVFGEGSQACEAVMSDCRVNLSRIPISPESTH